MTECACGNKAGHGLYTDHPLCSECFTAYPEQKKPNPRGWLKENQTLIILGVALIALIALSFLTHYQQCGDWFNCPRCWTNAELQTQYCIEAMNK